MASIAYWTGIYHIILGFSLYFPRLLTSLGIRTPDTVFWTETIAWLVIGMGVTVVICARNMTHRASVLYWVGLFHLPAGGNLIWFGFGENFGVVLGGLGVVDVGIGLMLILGLPGAVSSTHAKLMLDR